MGLFDQLSPADTRAAVSRENRAQDMSYATLPRGRGQVAAAASAGRMFGQALGGQDPRVAKAEKMQQIQGMMAQSGLQPGTYEFNMEAARLLQKDFPQEAMKAAEQGQKLKMASEDRTLSRENVRSQIDSRESKQPAGAVDPKEYGLDPQRYRVIKQPTGTVKIVDTKTRQSTDTRVDASTGFVHRFDNGKDMGPLQVNGKPMVDMSFKRNQRLQGQGDRRADQADSRLEQTKKRENTRSASLKFRKSKFIDEFGLKLSKEYQKDTKTMRGMSEQIDGALAILDKKDITPADAQLLQRYLAGINKANTRAQSEIDSWQAGEIGNVLQRLVGGLNSFFSGDVTENERDLYKEALAGMLSNHINPTFELYKDVYTKRSDSAGVDPEDVMVKRLNEAEPTDIDALVDKYAD